MKNKAKLLTNNEIKIHLSTKEIINLELSENTMNKFFSKLVDKSLEFITIGQLYIKREEIIYVERIR